MRLLNLFLVWIPNSSFNPFITIPVAPIVSGIITHISFHIRFLSIHALLYFSSFSAYFAQHFSPQVLQKSVIMHVFSFSFLIIISGLFSVTSLSVCTAFFHSTYIIIIIIIIIIISNSSPTSIILF